MCCVTGVTSHGLSCEACKCKVHKRCSAKAINNCKWTTLASIGKDIIEDQDGVCIHVILLEILHLCVLIISIKVYNSNQTHIF